MHITDACSNSGTVPSSPTSQTRQAILRAVAPQFALWCDLFVLRVQTEAPFRTVEYLCHSLPQFAPAQFAPWKSDLAARTCTGSFH